MLVRQSPTAGDADLTQADGSAVGPSVGLLGDFRILRELGRGGMGVVYEAEQLSLGRRVALKVLPFAAMLDKQQLARFKNEARAAATLDHPNIVAIYSVGGERGVHYYAMQLIEGQSLAQVIGAAASSEQGVRLRARVGGPLRASMRRRRDSLDASVPHSAHPPNRLPTLARSPLSTLPDFRLPRILPHRRPARHPSRRGPRPRPPKRHPPPRHQAGQPAGRRRRQTLDHRLRPGPHRSTTPA